MRPKDSTSLGHANKGLGFVPNHLCHGKCRVRRECFSCVNYAVDSRGHTSPLCGVAFAIFSKEASQGGNTRTVCYSLFALIPCLLTVFLDALWLAPRSFERHPQIPQYPHHITRLSPRAFLKVLRMAPFSRTAHLKAIHQLRPQIF